MIEFLSNYGLWIALAGVFFAMHWFGMGCGGHGSHSQKSKPKGGTPDEQGTTSPSSAPGEMPPAESSRRCHL
jgi:hypothetical protein